jgi:hypothetical protein
MSPSDFECAAAEILALANKCAGLSPADRPLSEFESYFLSLANRGFTRGEIWSVVSILARENRTRLDPNSYDALSDYLSVLSGDCAGASWIRFPREPSDPGEFSKYVLGRSWMKGWLDYARQVRPLCDAFQEKKIGTDEFGRAVRSLHVKHNL